ncbi:MAG: AbrB/MazE/SpoVT family DNA-binding domain-containing protein [Bacteroidota bacterium]|nr:AbrB/MazE/SpoVT family DNA-binding domain-containing protein [Bacteroidota bacterium]
MFTFAEKINMGYQVKIQRVERGKTKSFYINFPAAVAEACNIEKGEEMEWIVEDKNSFTLQRVKKSAVKQPKENE